MAPTFAHALARPCPCCALRTACEFAAESQVAVAPPGSASSSPAPLDGHPGALAETARGVSSAAAPLPMSTGLGRSSMSGADGAPGGGGDSGIGFAHATAASHSTSPPKLATGLVRSARLSPRPLPASPLLLILHRDVRSEVQSARCIETRASRLVISMPDTSPEPELHPSLPRLVQESRRGCNTRTTL